MYGVSGLERKGKLANRKKSVSSVFIDNKKSDSTFLRKESPLTFILYLQEKIPGFLSI